MIGYALIVAIACVSIALLLNVYRLLAGQSLADRVLALDTMVINAIAIIILFGIWNATTLFFEVALLLAMVGFVSTVAYCKFILRGDIVE